MDPTANRYRSAPEQPLELRTLVGPPLAVLVRELRIEVGEIVMTIEAELELEGATYGRCLDEGNFALDAPGRGPGPEPELGRPVRIQVRLRPHLADLLGDQEDPMAALIDHLFATQGQLAHVDAWRALDVTQQIDDLGVAMGYRTAWGAAAESA